MKSATKIIPLIVLGLLMSNCSMFSKKTEEVSQDASSQKEDTLDQYSSSGVYNDIQGEADAEEVTETSSYADDNYGSVGESEVSEQNDALLSGVEEEETTSSSDPLPVETLQTADKPVTKLPAYEKKQRKSNRKKASVAGKFKNGMYRFAKNCNMRSKPSLKAKKVGKVSKGKKLWVEGHNKRWVKVYKKSGAVYISRSCL